MRKMLTPTNMSDKLTPIKFTGVHIQRRWEHAMFSRIGHLAAHHARTVLVVTVLVMIGAGALGFTAFGKLKTEGFTDPNAESSQAQTLLDTHFGGHTNLLLLVNAGTATVDAAAVQQAGKALTDRLATDSSL